MSIYRRKVHSMAAEFVTPGHPDKVCDQMADTIVDAALTINPDARVAAEVTGGHGLVVAIGEMTVNHGNPDLPSMFDIGTMLKETYKCIGHHDHDIAVMVNMVPQSPHISQGVTQTDARPQGAGDQGIMVGYAIDDGPDFMPRTWSAAKALSNRLVELRRSGALRYLRPDGKSQVTMIGDEIVHVTLAAHHSEDVTLEQVQADLTAQVVHYVVPGLAAGAIVVNGTGIFELGGFEADAGTTGRKLMIDNYGPNIEVGGGAYSGKDPSKVDRSAAYFCRMVAKSIVAGRHAQEAIVKVGFAIGIAEPTYISVETNLPEDQNEKLERQVKDKFDFRPKAIIDRLGLKHPQGWCYRDTAAAGHYGDNRFPWEKPAEL